jgi:DNA-binding MarR family transcriptional regulator
MDKETRKRQVGRSLDRLVHAIELFNEHAAREVGLHVTDLRCIDILATLGGRASPKEIAAQIGISPSTVTSLIDRLETAGLIRRTANPADRRSILVELVDERVEPMLGFLAQVGQKFEAVVSDYSDAELARIQGFMDKIVAVAGQMTDRFCAAPEAGA